MNSSWLYAMPRTGKIKKRELEERSLIEGHVYR